MARLISRKQVEEVQDFIRDTSFAQGVSISGSLLVSQSFDLGSDPSEKSTITVTGEVLAPTSFVFSKNLRVNDYIKLAGGFADSADKKGIFVILPNGQAIRNLDRWRIGRSKIEPGSTIIVPRDSTPFNAISIFRIFTPILANFATAAAAISALD